MKARFQSHAASRDAFPGDAAPRRPGDNAWRRWADAARRGWRAPLAHFMLCGVCGAGLAWLAGETTLALLPNAHREAARARVEHARIEREFALGEISDWERARARERWARRYDHNPFVRVWNDPALAAPERDRLAWRLTQREATRDPIRQLAWCVALAMPLACALACAEPLASANAATAATRAAAALTAGLVCGAALAFAERRLMGGAADSAAGADWPQRLAARSALWALTGALVGWAGGVGDPLAGRRWRMVLGGAWGGWFGGAACLLLAEAGAPIALARGGVLLAIGASAGFAAGLRRRPRATAFLRGLSGLLAGKIFELRGGDTRVGASSACEVFVPIDTRALAEHAVLRPLPDGGFEVEPLAVEADIRVNGRPARRARLEDGDTLAVGRCLLRFESADNGPGRS